MKPLRCDCLECRELDQLPAILQGIPDAYQLRLFPERRHSSGKLQPVRKRGKQGSDGVGVS